MIDRRQFLRASAVISACALGTGLYTWRWEPHWLEVTKRQLAITLLPDCWNDARMVQMSDLHIGPRVSDSYLMNTFDVVKKLSPDLVVYTGDFMSYEGHNLSHLDRMLNHLPFGKMATFGVLGNHDYGPSWAHIEIADEVASMASAAGIRILRNEVVTSNGLQIIGLDDLWANQFKPAQALEKVDQTQASLVLSHNPDTADLPVWGNYSGWILSGHTHGGQCKAPFLPPPLLPVQNRKYTSGAFILPEGRRMYVSRGIGHLLRVRFNVRPEVTVFQLKRA